MRKLAVLLILVLFIVSIDFTVQAENEPEVKPNSTTETTDTKTDKDVAEEAAVDAGKVTKLIGTAEISRGDAKIAVELGTIVQVKDTITVASASLVELTLFNEPGETADDEKNPSVLTLSETAKLTIKSRKKEPSGDTTTDLNLEEGKLNSKVEDGRKPGWKQRKERAGKGPGTSKKTSKSNYQVSTPTAVAGVRGTEFILAVTPTKTFIYVKSGSVWAKELVKGDIRMMKRGRLLEIGITGFGMEMTATETEAEAMTSMNFSRDFNPFRMGTGTTPSPTDDRKIDPQARTENVDKTIKDSMDSVRGTTGSSGTPDPAAPPGINDRPTLPIEPPSKDLPTPPGPPSVK